MEPEQLQLGFLKVLKGSYMEEMALTYGLVAKRENKEPQTLRYAYTTPYQDWMKNSNFAISNDACGCNQKLLAENLLTNNGEALVTPQQLYQAYQQPKAEAVKIRQENGSARLNFRINKWA